MSKVSRNNDKLKSDRYNEVPDFSKDAATNSSSNSRYDINRVGACIPLGQSFGKHTIDKVLTFCQPSTNGLTFQRLNLVFV